MSEHVDVVGYVQEEWETASESSDHLKESVTSSSTAASASVAGSGGQEVTAASNTTAAAKSAASAGHRGEYNTDSQSHTRSNGKWLL